MESARDDRMDAGRSTAGGLGGLGDALSIAPAALLMTARTPRAGAHGRPIVGVRIAGVDIDIVHRSKGEHRVGRTDGDDRGVRGRRGDSVAVGGRHRVAVARERLDSLSTWLACQPLTVATFRPSR